MLFSIMPESDHVPFFGVEKSFGVEAGYIAGISRVVEYVIVKDKLVRWLTG